MTQTRIAIMQIGYDVPYLDRPKRTLDANVDLMAGYLAEAADGGADLAIAPECWSLVGLEGKSADIVAESVPGDGPVYSMFNVASQRHRMHVVGWTFEREGDRLYNTAFILSPEGELIGKYRKTHPVPPEETKGWEVSPGEDLPVFDMPFGRMGIMICFDNYFCEVARTLAVKGAKLICYPTMNKPRHTLSTLSAARAIDNGCFIASSVVIGEPICQGSAAIHDPHGEVLVGMGRRDGVAIGQIDLDRPYRFGCHTAEQTPHRADHRRFLLTNRRPHLYGPLTGEAII